MDPAAADLPAAAEGVVAGVAGNYGLWGIKNPAEGMAGFCSSLNQVGKLIKESL